MTDTNLEEILPKKNILILGANGFIGSAVTKGLLESGYQVRAVDRAWNLIEWKDYLETDHLEIQEADIADGDALLKHLKDIHTVLYFVSFSIPATSPRNLQHELLSSVATMDILLNAMAKAGTPRILFSSSGGTVYGDIGTRPAREDTPLAPLSSYGMGKVLCEQTIQFYSRIFGLSYLIMRFSNVYGSSKPRRVSQGVIDIFLDQLILKKPLMVWGSLDTVRDYLYVSDLISSVRQALDLPGDESFVFNVGSSKGHSLREIIDIMQNLADSDPEIIFNSGQYSGIPFNILDSSKIREKTGWAAQYTLEQGIAETWQRKKQQFHPDNS